MRGEFGELMDVYKQQTKLIRQAEEKQKKSLIGLRVVVLIEGVIDLVNSRDERTGRREFRARKLKNWLG